MYSPKVVEATQAELEAKLRPLFPSGFERHAVDEVQFYLERFETLFDRKGNPRRSLTADEQRFIQHEQILVKLDFAYWAERYATISLAASSIGPMYPLWTSQRLILEKIGEVEERAYFGNHPDGVLVTICKARQLGASTLSEALVAHRLTTHANVQALIASDTPDSSARMFRMAERMIRHLPFFLRPSITDDVKNAELAFANGSRVEVGAGKSTRGTEGKRGQIGRSGTFSVVHLTELSTWESASQIDDALFPAIPISPQTLVLLESTAKGRHNWWHGMWELALKGLGPSGHSLTPIFIPWYAEPEKYWLPAPTSWVPSPTTQVVAARAEQYGPRWMGGRVSLSRDQLYWYERSRSTAEEKERTTDPGALSKFLEEYPTDDEEAFQYSGHSIFPIIVRELHRGLARPLKAAFEVLPQKDLAYAYARRPAIPYEDALDEALQQKGLSLDQWTDPTRTPPRVPVELAAFDPSQDPVHVPPGMGLRRLSPMELSRLTSFDDYEGLLLVWEFPRKDQLYVLGADVSQGIGQDRSVGTVLRVGTTREPDEEVAQFVSSTCDPVDLAFVLDVMGRLYTGRDQCSALVAIECNGLGLQTQSAMLNHLGYDNFFIWQYEDAATATGRLTKKFGWWTSVRTRPIIVGRLIRAVKTTDPVTQTPDVRINSPFTVDELQDFQKPIDGGISDACAAPGAHDDCLMTLAISIHVAQTLQFEYGEPVAERRRRLSEESFRDHLTAEAAGLADEPRRAQNTDVTVEEIAQGWIDREEADFDPEHLW